VANGKDRQGEGKGPRRQKKKRDLDPGELTYPGQIFSHSRGKKETRRIKRGPRAHKGGDRGEPVRKELNSDKKKGKHTMNGFS